MEMVFWLFTDGDFALAESAVIVEYLDMKYGKAGARLVPEDPEECAKVSTSPICLVCDWRDMKSAIDIRPYRQGGFAIDSC